jgi:hypothetical protein
LALDGHIALKDRRLDQGLLDDLREWITAVPNPRLIIIDVLNRIRPVQKPDAGVYDYDVRSLEGLQGLAAEFGLAIIVVHHTRVPGQDELGSGNDEVSRSRSAHHLCQPIRIAVTARPRMRSGRSGPAP